MKNILLNEEFPLYVYAYKLDTKFKILKVKFRKDADWCKYFNINTVREVE